MKDKISLFSKIKSLPEFLEIRRTLLQGKKIVFTNGCFDIIHRGHIEYLSDAKTLGDVLVVGLNSDESIKRLKGLKRPINKEEDRALTLSALEIVDFVIIFEEDTPLKLIKAIKPDVLVKGGDWEVNQIVGADIVMREGGEVRSLPYIEGYSSTSIIEKILKKFTKGERG